MLGIPARGDDEWLGIVALEVQAGEPRTETCKGEAVGVYTPVSPAPPRYLQLPLLPTPLVREDSSIFTPGM